MTLTRTRRAPRDGGQSLMEVAITMPLFLILILGVAEVAHAFHSFNILVSASRETGRLGSRGETLFDANELASVVDDSTSNLNLFSDGLGRMVVIHAEANASGAVTSYDCQVVRTLGSPTACSSGDTKLDQASLQALLQESSPPAATDKFVVVELFYNHPLLILQTVLENPIPMYTYAIMPQGGW